MIAEAAYYLAQKRGFAGVHALDDWLAAEQQMRQVISPTSDSETTMNDTIQVRPKARTRDASDEDEDGASKGPPNPKKAEPTELVSVDDTIDGIAREALKEARRIEEAIRYRNNPGPVVAPQTGGSSLA
jgi:hypothetical protein